MSVLLEICARKAKHVQAQKDKISLEELISKHEEAPAPIPFVKAIKDNKETAIIAEVKKASPSKGIIRKDFDPVQIAQQYKRAGATCLSVLTDQPYFQGTDEYFENIRAVVDLPMLRKDFMVDPYQIFESRVMGADCILLIMAALEDEMAADLYELSVDLGMDVLVEIHNKEELERALKLNPAMIGVNNRNLKTLHVDVKTSHDLAHNMPDTVVKIAESGIDSNETIKNLQKSGYQGFLIGESLMRQPCVETALSTLLA